MLIYSDIISEWILKIHSYAIHYLKNLIASAYIIIATVLSTVRCMV